MGNSERTKSLKKKNLILSILHYLFLFGPLLTFVIIGYTTGTNGQRITLSLSMITAIVLALISVVSSVSHKAGLHRTILWVVIIGVMYCLKSIETMIWIVALCSIIDEIFFVPMLTKIRQKLTINKEIDKRG